MNRRCILGLGVFWLLLFSGCATLSEDQCRNGDWFGVGFADGLDGCELTRLEDHGKACGEFGVKIDHKQYLDGYREGLKQYCVPTNGYVVGSRGLPYHGVCRGPEGEKFLAYYRQGRKEYEIESRLEDIQKEIHQIDDRLIDGKLDKSERKRLKHRLRELEREQADLYVEKGVSKALNAPNRYDSPFSEDY